MEAWLREFSRELREGTYRPQAVRQMLIAKKQLGKLRNKMCRCRAFVPDSGQFPGESRSKWARSLLKLTSCQSYKKIDFLSFNEYLQINENQANFFSLPAYRTL